MRSSAQSSRPATHDVLVLGDGTELGLRPLCCGDRDGFAALFARLSPQSRYRRFLAPKHELTARELAYFTDVDQVTHAAFAAVDQTDTSIVGVARYVQHADRPRAAAVAVEVIDELQSIGIGAALACQAVRCARANGFELLTATALRENQPARALLRELEFRASAAHGSVIEFELEIAP